MKVLPKKLLPLTLFAIAVTSVFSIQAAQGFTETLEQVGSNVVATGSGAINLTGLSFFDFITFNSQIVPSSRSLLTGATISGPPFAEAYRGPIVGPSNFGPGGVTFASTATGDQVAIDGAGPAIDVPPGYVSGTALSDMATYNGATFASLGVIPGTYVWRWGAGANQNFTLIIGRAGVPDGGSTVSLLGFGLLGLAALRRKLVGKPRKGFAKGPGSPDRVG